MSSANRPKIEIDISFTTGPLATPAWTSVTAFVRDDQAVTIDRGKESELDTAQAGRCSFVLDNRTRRFDPENTSSPYYPNVLPTKQIRARALWQGLYYPLFKGTIEAWGPPKVNGQDALMPVTAVDALGDFFTAQKLTVETLYRGTWPSSDVLVLPVQIPGNRKVRVVMTGATAGSVFVAGTLPSGAPWSEIVNLVAGTNVVGLTAAGWKTITDITINGVPAKASAGDTVTVSIDGSFPTEFSNSAIVSLLDAGGWPAADRSINLGKSLIQGQTVSGQSLRQLIDTVVQTENGQYFIDREGRFVFRDRHARITVTTPTETYDKTGATSNLPYESLTLAPFDNRLIYNEVAVQRAGGAAATAADATSIARHFRRTFPTRTLQITSDLETTDAANWLLSLYKDPAQRIEAIVLQGELAPALLWSRLLAMELQQLIRVGYSPPGGAQQFRNVFIESLDWSIRKGRWELTLSVSPASAKTFWELGSSTRGVLGSTTRLAY